MLSPWPATLGPVVDPPHGMFEPQPLGDVSPEYTQGEVSFAYTLAMLGQAGHPLHGKITPAQLEGTTTRNSQGLVTLAARTERKNPLCRSSPERHYPGTIPSCNFSPGVRQEAYI